MPLFSIITINLNNAEGLARTIGSVMMQTFIDYEYIVVDGLSTDGSVDVINEFRSNVDQVLIESDTGIYNAMNKGLGLATGKFIQFLNSGDEFCDSDALRIVAAQIEEAELIYCDVKLFGGKSESVKTHPDHLSTRFQLTGMICHQAIFASLDLFKRTGGFDESFKVYGDYDWMTNAIRHQNASYRHIHSVLVKYQELGISQSTSKEIQRREKDRIHDKYFGAMVLWVYRLYRKLNDKDSN